MLNLKPIAEVREEFEQMVSEKISSAQKAGINLVEFKNLPDSTITELKKLGYPVRPSCNGSFYVTVL